MNKKFIFTSSILSTFFFSCAPQSQIGYPSPQAAFKAVQEDLKIGEGKAILSMTDDSQAAICGDLVSTLTAIKVSLALSLEHDESEESIMRKRELLDEVKQTLSDSGVTVKQTMDYVLNTDDPDRLVKFGRNVRGKAAFATKAIRLIRLNIQLQGSGFPSPLEWLEEGELKDVTIQKDEATGIVLFTSSDKAERPIRFNMNDAGWNLDVVEAMSTNASVE